MVFKGNHKNGEIEIVEPNKIFTNKYADIFNDEVIFPSGTRGTYLRIDNKPNQSVAVLPITKEGKIVVIKNFRHGVRGWGVEVPKGAVEAGESRLCAVNRELEEETGYICEKIIHLCEYSESPAVFSSKIDCFIALGCKKTSSAKPEKTEAIDSVVEISVSDFLNRNYKADFIDSVSELLVLKYIFMKENADGNDLLG